jgi:HEAT repeat protein
VFHVDRWYRGEASANPSLNFKFDAIFSNGHNCIDFQPNSHWIVFAAEKGGHLELIDDCNGALTVSPLLGPDFGNTDWLAQMEADFVAGLDDTDSDARLTSIQRLGGLKLASSRAVLHRVIEQGSAEESKWAIYAALRTGDVTVLQKVKQLLANGDHDTPERAIALELRNTTDVSAVPDLIAILDGSPGELTRSTVTTALAEKLKDPRAVPSLAAHLSDSDPYVRYNALDGLKNMTHEGACTLPAEWKESDVEPKIFQCKSWWEHEGKLRTWTQN